MSTVKSTQGTQGEISNQQEAQTGTTQAGQNVAVPAANASAQNAQTASTGTFIPTPLTGTAPNRTQVMSAPAAQAPAARTSVTANLGLNPEPLPLARQNSGSMPGAGTGSVLMYEFRGGEQQASDDMLERNIDSSIENIKANFQYGDPEFNAEAVRRFKAVCSALKAKHPEKIPGIIEKIAQAYPEQRAVLTTAAEEINKEAKSGKKKPVDIDSLIAQMAADIADGDYKSAYRKLFAAKLDPNQMSDVLDTFGEEITGQLNIAGQELALKTTDSKKPKSTIGNKDAALQAAIAESMKTVTPEQRAAAAEAARVAKEKEAKYKVPESKDKEGKAVQRPQPVAKAKTVVDPNLTQYTSVPGSNPSAPLANAAAAGQQVKKEEEKLTNEQLKEQVRKNIVTVKTHVGNAFNNSGDILLAYEEHREKFLEALKQLSLEIAKDSTIARDFVPALQELAWSKQDINDLKNPFVKYVKELPDADAEKDKYKNLLELFDKALNALEPEAKEIQVDINGQNPDDVRKNIIEEFYKVIKSNQGKNIDSLCAWLMENNPEKMYEILEAVDKYNNEQKNKENKQEDKAGKGVDERLASYFSDKISTAIGSAQARGIDIFNAMKEICGSLLRENPTAGKHILAATTPFCSDNEMLKKAIGTELYEQLDGTAPVVSSAPVQLSGAAPKGPVARPKPINTASVGAHSVTDFVEPVKPGYGSNPPQNWIIDNADNGSQRPPAGRGHRRSGFGDRSGARNNRFLNEQVAQDADSDPELAEAMRLSLQTSADGLGLGGMPGGSNITHVARDTSTDVKDKPTKAQPSATVTEPAATGITPPARQNSPTIPGK